MKHETQRKHGSPSEREDVSSPRKNSPANAVNEAKPPNRDTQGRFSDGGLTRERRFLDRPRVPANLERLIEAYIEKKTGKRWDDPVVLSRLRAAVIAQKRDYWREGEKRRISYHTGYQVLGYLAYQLPVFFVQFQHLLLELAREGLIKPDLRVFDVGTGPGVVPLAVIDFLRRAGGGSATLFGLDASEEHCEAYRFLVPASAGKNPHIHVEPPLCADLRIV
ncbi:MAG: 2-hydroxyacyl-CoA dehydratase family protein, partial [Methanomicrobiales archaeon]|nr:2-hydroxyacyl-CoA dehydratase family protein [Methanomicrobiales archaeon]